MSDLLNRLVSAIRDKHGEDAARLGSDASASGIRGWVSTGSSSLDKAIGAPGVPLGRITTVIGDPADGKTTFVTHLIAEVQKLGGTAVLLDTEYTFTRDRSEKIGVSSGNLLLLDAETVEDAFEQIFTVLESLPEDSKPVVILWDSVSATPTRSQLELENDASRSQLGEHARLFSLQLRRLIRLLSQKPVALVLVCQTKDVIRSFGPAAKTFVAARPIKFHSSLIVEFARLKSLYAEHGITARVRVMKNKVGPSFGECEIDIFEAGYDEGRNVFEKMVAAGLLVPKGRGFFSIKGVEKNMRRKEIEENAELMKRLGEELAAVGGKEDGEEERKEKGNGTEPEVESAGS